MQKNREDVSEIYQRAQRQGIDCPLLPQGSGGYRIHVEEKAEVIL